MREIKFRAWNPLQKRMVFGPYGDDVNASWVLAMCEANDMEPMQFTGLRDKNGKEIYESDKIIWTCKSSIVVGIVYWGRDGWFVKDERGGNVTRLFRASAIEVVGNTYEN